MRSIAIAAMAATGVVSSASGQLISFTYSDLNGSFDSASSTYSAVAQSASSGDVSRLDSNPGTAEFSAGSFPAVNSDFNISLSVSAITATTAQGNGTLVITDADGDTLSMDVTGEFSLLFGSVFYEGFLSNAFFNNESGDGTFDGESLGSFDNPVPAGPYVGSVVELFFDPGNFFGSDFSGEDTLLNGILIPSPASAAVLGLGALAAVRRRR